MNRFLATKLCVGVLLVTAGKTSAGLIGVTGDGAWDDGHLWIPETLFTVDTTDASLGYIVYLGNGYDGEAIGFDPTTGLLGHWSGIGAFNDDEIMEFVDLTTLSVTNVTLSGDYYGEALAATFDRAAGHFLLSGNFFDAMLYSVTSTGEVTLIGDLDHESKGLAFVGSTLYSISKDESLLRTIDKATGATLTSIPMEVSGAGAQTPVLRGANGLATDPATGELYVVYKYGPDDRRLGIIDPDTGLITGIGPLQYRLSGIAFTNQQVPEPSSLALLGMGLTGLCGYRWHRKRQQAA